VLLEAQAAAVAVAELMDQALALVELEHQAKALMVELLEHHPQEMFVRAAVAVAQVPQAQMLVEILPEMAVMVLLQAFLDHQ
jgi:hypothetical protein